MALRVRKDGRLLCAVIHAEEPGDTYLDDLVHEALSGATGNKPVIGTELWERHRVHGEWWWLGNVPEGVVLDSFYTPVRISTFCSTVH